MTRGSARIYPRSMPREVPAGLGVRSCAMAVTKHSAVHPAVSTAGDIMSAPAITVPADATRSQIADLLTAHRISSVPVLDSAGRILGLVSKLDLLAKSSDDAAALMTTAVITVSVDTPLDDVRHLLTEREILRLPVVRGGELAGVLSRGDLVATMATEWVCEVCGEPVRGSKPPDACPKCGSGPERFAQQEQLPGD